MGIKEYFQELKDDSVTITLLLTLKCNFSCDRCFYFSSPKMPKNYMSDEVLEAVRIQAEWLTSHDVGVQINLIGGEPTLNMAEFERVLRTVSQWHRDGDIQGIEMTTNGWWLNNVASTRRFLETVCRCAPGFGLEEGFVVRISSSQYHDSFRPRYLQGKGKLDNRLKAIWNPWDYDEEFQVLNEEERVCDECREPWDEDDDGFCMTEGCDCGDWDYAEVYEFPWNVPNPEDGDAWIYVDEQRDGYTIMSGRAAYFGIGDVRNISCRSDVLTYKPDGVLSDVCCRGSDLPVGTVHDNPLNLLWLANRYFKEATPNCWDCARTAREWMKNNGLVPPETTVDFAKLYA